MSAPKQTLRPKSGQYIELPHGKDVGRIFVLSDEAQIRFEGHAKVQMGDIRNSVKEGNGYSQMTLMPNHGLIVRAGKIKNTGRTSCKLSMAWNFPHVREHIFNASQHPKGDRWLNAQGLIIEQYLFGRNRSKALVQGLKDLHASCIAEREIVRNVWQDYNEGKLAKAIMTIHEHRSQRDVKRTRSP